jgi:hypothetical protein
LPHAVQRLPRAMPLTSPCPHHTLNLGCDASTLPTSAHPRRLITILVYAWVWPPSTSHPVPFAHARDGHRIRCLDRVGWGKGACTPNARQRQAGGPWHTVRPHSPQIRFKAPCQVGGDGGMDRGGGGDPRASPSPCSVYRTRVLGSYTPWDAVGVTVWTRRGGGLQRAGAGQPFPEGPHPGSLCSLLAISMFTGGVAGGWGVGT